MLYAFLERVQVNTTKDFAPRFSRLYRKSLFQFDKIFTDDSSIGHPDFQLFFSFHVFRDFFYAVFCADSENVLKNVIRSTFGKLWGGFDPPLFQNLVNILNSVFSFKVMILRAISFERALNSVQFKKKFV